MAFGNEDGDKEASKHLSAIAGIKHTGTMVVEYSVQKYTVGRLLNKWLLLSSLLFVFPDRWSMWSLSMESALSASFCFETPDVASILSIRGLSSWRYLSAP